MGFARPDMKYYSKFRDLLGLDYSLRTGCMTPGPSDSLFMLDGGVFNISLENGPKCSVVAKMVPRTHVLATKTTFIEKVAKDQTL